MFCVSSYEDNFSKFSMKVLSFTGQSFPYHAIFRGFKPGRSRRIFQGEKNPPFGREVKLFVPCRRFTACKRSLSVTWKSDIFRLNSSAISRPSSSSFHYQDLWWRHLEVQVGKTKDQGLYNKPSDAVHPAALAAGTLQQYKKTPQLGQPKSSLRKIRS